MSGRRHSTSHESRSPEPIVLERDPQIYNLFRTRTRRVRIVEESPIRSRRQQRRIRTPSPSPSPSPSPPPPPSPPRGLYRRMTTRIDEDDIFAPLPPKLPPKGKAKYPREDDVDYIIEERRPQRYRKVKIVHSHPKDEDAHPRVETPTSPRGKRDSGKYYTEARPAERPSSARSDFDRRRTDEEVRKVTADLNHMILKERRERLEAERAAAIAEEEINRLKADLVHERRKRSLEKRERAAAERERRLASEQERVVEVRRPVVIHNPIAAVVPTRDNHRTALDRAQDDYRKLDSRNEHAVREEARPSTAERRPRRPNVVIVEDPRDHGHGGHGRR